MESVTLPKNVFTALVQRLGEEMRRIEGDLTNMQNLMNALGQTARFHDDTPPKPVDDGQPEEVAQP
jgi:hypothetical protein